MRRLKGIKSSNKPLTKEEIERFGVRLVGFDGKIFNRVLFERV